MNDLQKFSQQVQTLIDELKSVCANYGLGNDGNEFKIITQVFLYKFLHDKFVYEIKLLDKQLQQARQLNASVLLFLASHKSNDHQAYRQPTATPKESAREISIAASTCTPNSHGAYPWQLRQH